MAQHILELFVFVRYYDIITITLFGDSTVVEYQHVMQALPAYFVLPLPRLLNIVEVTHELCSAVVVLTSRLRTTLQRSGPTGDGYVCLVHGFIVTETKKTVIWEYTKYMTYSCMTSRPGVTYGGKCCKSPERAASTLSRFAVIFSKWPLIRNYHYIQSEQNAVPQ